MPTARYDSRRTAILDNQMYKELYDKHGKKFFKIYRTGMLKYPTLEEIKMLNIRGHRWSYGDRYDKLASKYYGDPRFWWVIAWFNKKPLEQDLRRGQVLNIPFPLEYVLDFMGA